MCWSPDSEHLCSSGGKVIHVWHNQVALEETLRDLKKQLDSATSEAHKVGNFWFEFNPIIVFSFCIAEAVRENKRNWVSKFLDLIGIT